MSARSRPRTLKLVTLCWRPFTSVRSRILGWSVLLLAVALTASTVAMHVFLVRHLDTRVNAELAHEIAEFRALEAQRATGTDTGGADGTATSVLALLRARTSQAVLERDTVLIGLIGRADRRGQRELLASRARRRRCLARALVGGRRTRASGGGGATPVGGSAQLAVGPAQYLAVPAAVPGAPVTGVFVALVLTGPSQAGITRTTRAAGRSGRRRAAARRGGRLAHRRAGASPAARHHRTGRPDHRHRHLRPHPPLRGPAWNRPSPYSRRRACRRPGRSEISELAHTLNRMLDRLEGAVITQRRFLADAGHELRTPIAIIQGNLDTLTATTDEDAQTLAIVATS